MISVICVYNNKRLLDDWLLKSLNNQSVKYELITLDNTSRQFKSAAQAYNHGGKKASGNHLMFVHQDVCLCPDSCLENTEEILDGLTNFGAVGAAGIAEGCKRVFSNLRQGPSLLEPLSFIHIDSPAKVQTLDECLIIIPKSVFDTLSFDEKMCDDWHLYAVDYCLSAKKLGFDIYAIPMTIQHMSIVNVAETTSQLIRRFGIFPKGYYQTLKKILNKHRYFVKKIYPTTGNWRTGRFLVLQRIWTIIPLVFIAFLIKIGIRYLWRKSGLKYYWGKLRKQRVNL